MRRLPIYFVIDVSESMVGTPIEAVEKGLDSIVKELRQDPYALETVFLSVIAFAGRVEKLAPLNELLNFYLPKLPIGGGTALGKALNHLMDTLDCDIKPHTSSQKGDWKPLIFLMTDGRSTDETANAVKKWSMTYQKKASLICIAFGNKADLHILNQLSEQSFLFDNMNPTAYQQFFKWVTASIRTASQSIQSGDHKMINLEKDSPSTLAKIDLNKSTWVMGHDDDFAVFTGKCQKKHKLYLIKYERLAAVDAEKIVGNPEFSLYRLDGAYVIDETAYKRMSSPQYAPALMNTRHLLEYPHCPCCGNPYGISMCPCGGIFCSGEETTSQCPWCESHLTQGSEESDSLGINLGRGQG